MYAFSSGVVRDEKSKNYLTVASAVLSLVASFGLGCMSKAYFHGSTYQLRTVETNFPYAPTKDDVKECSIVDKECLEARASDTFHQVAQRTQVSNTTERMSAKHIVNPVNIVHDELFKSEKYQADQFNESLFFNSALQGEIPGDIPYHEAHVHPGMFAQPNPRRIAIVGGGDIAVLREVLKHKTVDYVDMVEPERNSINLNSKNNLYWNDCSDLLDSSMICSSDARVTISVKDVMEWISDEKDNVCHGEDSSSCGDASLKVKYDVIIMNLSTILHDTKIESYDYMMGNIYDILSKKGVLIVQMGQPPFINDSTEDESKKHRVRLVDAAAKSKYESIHIYEESHGGVEKSMSYMVACSNYNCRLGWYANEEYTNSAIHRRIRRTRSGLPALKYFDGATMCSYQRPLKAWETMFCSKNPKNEECIVMNGFDPSIPNVSSDKFEVKVSSLGEDAGRGLFTTVDIMEGSYIMQETAVHSVDFSPHTSLVSGILYDELDDCPEKLEEIGTVWSYMIGYGGDTTILGGVDISAETGINAFMNHGCNGNYNFGELETARTVPWVEDYATAAFFSEEVADANRAPFKEKIFAIEYNPVLYRRLEHQWRGNAGSLQIISKGEELFTNYMKYFSDAQTWFEDLTELRAECRGEAIGLVVQLDHKLANNTMAISQGWT